MSALQAVFDCTYTQVSRIQRPNPVRPCAAGMCELPLFLLMTSTTLVTCKPDPWRATGCILTPCVDAIMSRVPPSPPFPMCSPLNMQHYMLEVLTPAWHSGVVSGATTLTLVLTAVHNRLIILVGTNSYQADWIVETSVLVYAQANVDFHAAYRYLAAAPECCTTQVFAACCLDVSVGSASYPSVQPAGVGATVHAKVYIQVRVRAWTPAVTGLVPVVSARGAVVKCLPAYLSPLFQHVYLLVSADGVDVWDNLKADVAAECGSVVHALEGMSASGFAGLTPPPMTLHVPADVPSIVLSLYDSPSLFESGVAVLQSLVSSATLSDWFMRMETQPTCRTSVVCVGYWMAKSRHLTLGVNHAAASAQQVAVWRDMLMHRHLLMAEMEGLVFDLCMQGHTLDSLPPYFHPATFCDDPQGAGYLTMLYLLQWRQTLKRFLEVAHERVHELPGASQMLPLLAHFRVGILVQAPGVTPCKSTHRMCANEHSFFINLSGHDVLNMHSKSTLQQQRAEDRNVVVAYFMGQALNLLGDVLCPGDAKRAVAVLTEGYFAALKPKSMLNLAKLYERMQGMARKFRQEVCSLKQAQQGRSKGKRKIDE